MDEECPRDFRPASTDKGILTTRPEQPSSFPIRFPHFGLHGVTEARREERGDEVMKVT